jgi:hypothetical protein
MRLLSVGIKDFKNLRDVSLNGLGAINLIHGPNNVGKSNLLHAMAVLFRCLRPSEGELPFTRPRPLLERDIHGLGLQPFEMFNLASPRDIRLTAQIAIPRAELEQAGITEVYPCDPLDIEVVLSRIGDRVELRITRFRFSDGTDAAQRQPNADEKARCLRFALFLTANLLVREGPVERFAIIGVQRRAEEDMILRQSEEVPLALEMFDSRESLDASRAQRWKAFTEAMHHFESITGEGEFLATFQRKEDRARLVFDTKAGGRIPLRLMGTGVQQLVSLLGQVLMSNASIVAIEEPELNLRWDVQETLKQVLAKLVGQPEPAHGPHQLFLCSHSPAFETADGFFLLQPGTDGPTVQRRPESDVEIVLNGRPATLGLPANAPQAYVTSQGIVKLPMHIREHMHLSRGGGVVFVAEGEEQARLLTDEAYFRSEGVEHAPG